LFGEGEFYHPDKRAKFLFSEPQDLPESTDSEYPFILLTGRGSSSQWHTQTRTAKSDVLRKLYPKDCYVEINTEDATRRGISPNQRVLVQSRRGEVEATAFVVNTVSKGQLFMPMHYAKTNQLTHASFDPHSRPPSYKYSAVKIDPI
jgi:assimilatory nitrate reductase catalytic subunit